MTLKFRIFIYNNTNLLLSVKIDHKYHKYPFELEIVVNKYHKLCI